MGKLKMLTIVIITLFTVTACGGEDNDTAVRVSSEDAESTVEEVIVDEAVVEEVIEPDVIGSYDERTIEIGAIHYPPFEIYENGAFTGPGIDTVREAFNRMGYAYEIKEYPWARLLEMMETGELDIILDLSKTDERSEFLDFSKEIYGVYAQAFYARKDSGIVFDGSIDSLKDYKIGYVRDYFYNDEFSAAIENNVINHEDSDNSEILFKKLNEKRVDVVIELQVSGDLMINDMGINDEIERLAPVYSQSNTYVGFGKARNLAELRDEYDSAVRSMIDDGTLVEIYAKYGLNDVADMIGK